MDLDELLMFLREHKYERIDDVSSSINRIEELEAENNILREKVERKSRRIDELMDRNFKLFSEIGEKVKENDHTEKELHATEDELGNEDKKEEDEKEEKKKIEDLFDEKGELK